VIYPFSCPEHGEHEIVGGVDKATSADCPVCGAPMRRLYTAVPYTVDFSPGWQPAFGKWVETKRERDNLVAEKGLKRG